MKIVKFIIKNIIESAVRQSLENQLEEIKEAAQAELLDQLIDEVENGTIYTAPDEGMPAYKSVQDVIHLLKDKRNEIDKKI